MSPMSRESPPSSFPAFAVRDGTDDDGPALIAIIAEAFSAYPGCVLDIDGEMPELRAPATAAAAENGRFWVIEAEGAVVATISCRPAAVAGVLELKRLYVAKRARRRGLARLLVALVEAEAAARGLPMVELWSDRRFTTAHRLYEALGYRRGEETRALDDRSHTVEYYFWRDISNGGAAFFVPELFL